MKIAYVDTSCLVAVAFGEDAGGRVGEVMSSFDTLLGANLTVAELRAAGVREELPEIDDFIEDLTLVLPARSLAPELARSLEGGYLRGADLLHIATALYAAESPGDIVFLTLDERQREVAAAVGFQTPF